VGSLVGMIVLDASAAIEAYIDSPSTGEIDRLFEQNTLLAPQSLGVEVMQGFRRMVFAGESDERQASLAIRNIMELPIVLMPFEPFVERIWELRHNVSAHDAWYVAIAETFGVPLATTDRRLANATGPTCEFVVL
jgi:predicted nucleic acid-binding protein